MKQLNSCQMGKFEKVTIQGVDVKFSSFGMALENWQTTQMSPGKSPKIISLWPGIICLCKVMINDRTFSVQIIWKILLKIIKKHWKTQIYRITPWNFILLEKAWNFGGDSQIKFFHTKHPLEAFPDPSFLLSKVSTQQNRFFKKKPNKILSLLIFSIGGK